ncbi:MAG: ABC transporter substrate-binding protein [Spirochaetales bacterium]|nr:ABC transporter substrate-binding protein [Spirochaetales bacterium]MCF7938429.1 ABC transporter substrate-binding protein [Spirochaetales bacterium]
MKTGLRLIVAGLLLVGLTFSVAAEGAQEDQKGKEGEVEMTQLTWVSPRGTLEVMDDYNVWVAKEMGYFEEMGLSITMEPGPTQALADIKLVDRGQADIAYPSPGVLTSGIDQGVDVIAAYELMGTQVFDFAVAADSDIKTVQDIEGKTIAMWFAGWDVIIKPMLVELGIDPDSVEYKAIGQQWGQAVSQGKADVALTWKGLRAQWDAIGLDLRYFKGEDFSDLPANVYAIRKDDLNDPEKREVLEKFFRASSMGIHFARHNPRAAAQLTYKQFSAIREQMTPELALESMHQLHNGYVWSKDNLGDYGRFPIDKWEKYLKIISDLGQTENVLETGNVVTNELIEAANDFDRARVERDAKNFKLNDTWSEVEVTGSW